MNSCNGVFTSEFIFRSAFPAKNDYCRLHLFTVGCFEDDFDFPFRELCVVTDEVDVPGSSTFCRSSSELLVSVYILKLSLEVLSKESFEDSSRASATLFFFSVKELSWSSVKSLLLMTHVLEIGFSKAIRGKGLSKNKPPCENAVA